MALPASSDSVDRSLPIRTLIAAILSASAGVAIAAAMTKILGEIAVPSFSKYLLPVSVERELAALAEWVGAPGAATRAIWISWFVVGAAGLAFPFLFNRLWFSRRIFSLPGIARVLATFAILGLVEFLTANAPGSLPVNALAYEGWKAIGFSTADFALRVGAGAIGTAVFFVIVGETAWGGVPDKWLNPNATRREITTAAILGAASGAAIAVLGEFASTAIPVLLESGLSLFNESAEVTRRGWERVATSLTLTLAFSTAAVGALLVALSPSRAGRRRRALALAIAVLPAGGAVGTILGYRHHFDDFAEGRITSLAAAAKLEAAPAPRLLLLPGEKGPAAHLYEMTAKVLGTKDDEEIGATVNNIALIKKYLSERASRWTFHSLKAWNAEGVILDRLLEPDAAIRARHLEAEKISSLIATQLLSIRLPKMPVTPAVREVSEKLLDGARYLAKSGSVKARLAAIARNLDLTARAADLERAAAESRDDSTKNPVENDARGPATGVVSGRIAQNGAAPPPMRVALYRFPVDGRVIKPPLASINLLAAQTTATGGAFKFEHLRPAKYMVGVLMPESAGSVPSNIRATGNLGPFDTATTNRIDAGLIEISRAAP